MSASSSEEEEGEEEGTYCLCGEGYHGEMVGCDGVKCPYGGWFHYECVGLRRHPRGEWLCPGCDRRAKTREKRRVAQAREVARQVAEEKRQRKKRRMDSEVIEDEEESNLPPLTVASAERQSRAAMDEMLACARRVPFKKSGAADELQNPEVGGLCKVSVEAATFATLRSLHRIVVDRLRRERRLTAWAGVSEGDARERGYAFLPRSCGAFGKSTLRAAGVEFHSAAKSGEAAKEDEAANWRSCVRLKETDVTVKHRAALGHLAAAVGKVVPRRYKGVVSLDNLQALQPNLHNGRDHLPPHIDHPLNDGFGVVIVTLCIAGTANVVIIPEKAERRKAKPFTFEAKEGEAYVLSGAARNACDHGVVCPLAPTRSRALKTTARSSRESLNLRFGLHTRDPAGPFYAFDEMPVLLEEENDDDDDDD